MIDISIVIVTYKTKEFLRQCLASVYVSNFNGESEIIVVDNGSFDGTAEMLKQKYPHVILIENNENKGVAKARNQGLKAARGRYCLLLDSDAILGRDALKILISEMDKNARVAVGGPKVFFPNGIVQPSCRRFPTPLSVLFRGTFLGRKFSNAPFLKKYLMEDFDHNSQREVDWVFGACQIIRVETLGILNYLDENYFFACEDTDFCWRAWKAGWKVLFIPEAQIIHYYQRGSARGVVNRLKREHIKSLLRFFRKKYVHWLIG